MAQAKKKAIKTSVPKESSSEYFARIRPKFLDWNPPTPEEALAEVQKRKDDREAELRKVTALEKAKLAEKKSGEEKARRLMRPSRLRAALAAALLASAFAAHPFDLQGHRGARGLAPENTLPAFAAALSLGVTTLELDTGVTKDGVVVVSHEPWPHPDTARGPDGAWLTAHGPAILSMTYAELARYDVGRLNPASGYGKRYPEQKPVDGTRIPRLADLFALVKRSGNTAVRFNIETKIDPHAPQSTLPPEAFARALVAAIREAGMAGRASIQSFDWRTLKVVQAEAPEIPTVYLTAQQKWLDNVAQGSPWTAGVQFDQHGSVPKMVKASGGHTWSPFFADVDAAKVAEAKALGLAVVVWTVNEPADIAKMLDLGVDGIISDRPDRVRAEMQKRGMQLPTATPVTP